MPQTGSMRARDASASAAAWDEAPLDPARIAESAFLGAAHGPAGQRVFGGRLLAEALVAAGITAPEGLSPHSISGQFLEPAAADRERRIEVERLRDGGTLGARAVRIEQDGKLLALFIVSLATGRPSAERRAAMPTVPGPESLPDMDEVQRGLAASDPLLHELLFRRPHPLEVRPVRFEDWVRPEGDEMLFWFRPRPPLRGATPLDRAAALAYASDRFVLLSAALPHHERLAQFTFRLATISHALWIHRDYAPGSWLLSRVRATSLGEARAFIRSEIFAQNGEHVASAGQEGLFTMRPHR